MKPVTTFTLAMDFAPDESQTTFPGIVTITKTALTVHRRSGGGAPTAMPDPATNERASFVGVCSLPLIQFYRHKDIVSIMRGSSLLFDNAAASIGLHSEVADRSNRESSIKGSDRSRRDNPTMWETLAMHFSSLGDCDRVVECLLSRGAEETLMPPFPIRSGSHLSHNLSTPPSVNSSPHHNHHHHRRRHHHHHQSPDARASIAGRDSHHSRPNSPSVRSRRLASSSINERPEQDDVTHYADTHSTPPRMRVSTPHSARLPSRLENDDATTQLSVRTRESTPRSSRLPSRQENDDLASVATPSRSIRSLQQRVAPGRSILAGRSSLRASDELQEPHPSHYSAERSRAASAATSMSHRHLHSSVHRRLVDPAEREFAQTAGHPPSPSRPRRHHSHSASSRSRHRNGTPSAASAAEGCYPRRHRTPSSARGEPSAAPRSASVSTLDQHASPRTTATVQGASVTSPRIASHANKSSQNAFLRSVQRLQHHRLHLMQYLHKEIVRQTYLAEEAKVKAAVAAAKASPSHHRSNSPLGGRATEAIAAEAARLREIETRLVQVEALHNEAEREREEAARLRREYEWRIEEMNAHNGNGAMPGTITGSHNVSEPSSSVMSPHRSSVYPVAEQLVVVPQQNGGGSTYPLTAHQGCLMSAEWMLAADPAAAPRPDDVDLGVAIIDRYVFGEEWNRIYPAYEADIRFNAQIDVCLAMRLPRRLVTITSLAVDRPGLRLTVEIRYNRVHIERDGLERRMHGCPFRFLHRFYDMRDLYDPMHDGAASLASGKSGRIASASSAASGRRPSSMVSRRMSRTMSAQRRRPVPGRLYSNSDSNSGTSDTDDDYDMDARRDHYYRRTEDRVRAAEHRMAKRRECMAAELRHQLAENMAQLAVQEEYLRDGIRLEEAKSRQKAGKEARSNVRSTLTTSMANLEEEERVERAATEVGAARQLHVLIGGHRRTLAVFTLQASEAQRRKRIVAQESQARRDLDDAMNPARAAQRKQAERQAREEEVLSSRGAWHTKKPEWWRAAVADLEADEVAARAIVRSQAMEALLDLLFRSPVPKSQDGRHAPLHAPSTLKALLGDLQEDEVVQRQQMLANERRRRVLYQQEDVMKREAVDRVHIETMAIDTCDAIVDKMMALNRHQLERRLMDREQLMSLINEEQFYRRTILSDEQDAFEVIAELFAVGLKVLLTHMPEIRVDDNDEDLRRRRVSTTRKAKPFHYMTFSPDDMDYPPSAVLAIEGILGCSINKNLEVVSVARPLPKAEEKELQLQAGDMILDMTGHSLHSLSHLREVLSHRAMQIQEEAFAEFPEVPHNQLTINPALQKYIEVLCEHHNFLVQVLRGCEIYQIIVRS
ncbi:hypothetical protein JKF63_07525 [Porcisia hertigi]|uniref:PDZ domain-containing protein n=1 Tax=Porcisia hertigi TaxID=2761500 RepID=A0A836IQ22_9TRYP|nr:hypothetical protein JKF63_07525 [Porcisia hertigi]